MVVRLQHQVCLVPETVRLTDCLRSVRADSSGNQCPLPLRHKRGVDDLADDQQQHLRTVFCTVWTIGTNRKPTNGV